VATFSNLGITGTSGVAYTITYTASGLTSATQSVTVSLGAATKSLMTTEPAGAVDGVAFTTQPVVRITDSGGNTVTSSSVDVVATIASGTGTLSGTTTVKAVGGVATFTNLVITTANTFTLTFTPTPLTPVTSDSFAVAVATCANGGTCVVGDTGPGGGIVFYALTSTTFPATGATCRAGGCKYLEAAPTGWGVTPANGCANGGGATTDPTCVWSGNTTGAIGTTAQGTNIGTGYSNTTAIITQSSTVGKAATASRAYQPTVNAVLYNDWFLPSKDELNEMCKYAKEQTTGNTLTICANTVTLRSGFSAGSYWSSSEDPDPTRAWVQYFPNALRLSSAKTNPEYVRPVRAF